MEKKQFDGAQNGGREHQQHGAQPSPDITHVDQQEGAMNNGELGANLNEQQGRAVAPEKDEKQSG